MWAVDMSRHTVDVPSEGLRNKCGLQDPGNPTPSAYLVHSVLMISWHLNYTLLGLPSQRNWSCIS